MASKGDQSLYMKERQVHVYTTCMWIYILDLFKQISHYMDFLFRQHLVTRCELQLWTFYYGMFIMWRIKKYSLYFSVNYVTVKRNVY